MKKRKTPHGIKNGKFRSLLETQLSLKLRNERFEYEPKDKKLTYRVERKYQIDFYLPEKQLYIEAKGYFTSSDRAKMLYIKEQYPHLKIAIVFQNPSNKLNKNSSTTYSAWCDKHGFLWCGITDLSPILK